MKRKDALIMLADILDSSGFHAQANTLDILSKMASNQSRAVSDFVDALKGALSERSQSFMSVDEVIGVIDSVLESRDFIGPRTSAEEFMEIKDKVNQAVLNVAQYEDAIAQLSSQIEKSEDEETGINLMNELKGDMARLQEIYAEINSWRNSRRRADRENYERFLKQFREYTGREYEG